MKSKTLLGGCLPEGNLGRNGRGQRVGVLLLLVGALLFPGAMNAQTGGEALPLEDALTQSAQETAGTFLDRGILFAMRREYERAIEDFS